MVRNGNCRVSAGAHAKVHVHIRRGRRGRGIEIIRLSALIQFFIFLVIHEFVIFIPSHLVLAHPERRHLHPPLRALFLAAAFFGGRAAHQKRAALDGHHLEARQRVGNLIHIRLHRRLRHGLVLGHNFRVNGLDDFIFVLALNEFLLRLELQPIRPRGPLVNPQGHQRNIFLRGPLHLLLGRHHFLVVQRQRHRFPNRAALVIAGLDAPTLQRLQLDVQLIAPAVILRLPLAMATHAVVLQNRLNLLYEIHLARLLIRRHRRATRQHEHAQNAKSFLNHVWNS